MSMISTEEFLHRGHQVDLDMMNLDTAIHGVKKNSPSSVPSSELLTWEALKADWDKYYHENIEIVPMMPIQSSSDLDLWLGRFEEWTAKNKQWALLSLSPTAINIAQAMPASPAAVEHKENPPIELLKGKNVPPIVWLGIGTVVLGVIGYTIAGVARLEGR